VWYVWCVLAHCFMDYGLNVDDDDLVNVCRIIRKVAASDRAVIQISTKLSTLLQFLHSIIC